MGVHRLRLKEALRRAAGKVEVADRDEGAHEVVGFRPCAVKIPGLAYVAAVHFGTVVIVHVHDDHGGVGDGEGDRNQLDATRNKFLVSK